MLSESNTLFSDDDLPEYISEMDELGANDIWNGQILLVSDDPYFGNLYQEIVQKVGGRCPDALPIAFDSDALTARLNVVAVILHLAKWDKANRAALDALELFCCASNIPLLLRIELDLLDDVMARVKYANVEHLLSDNAAEFLVALESRISRSQNAVLADRDEIDITDLRKISADVERIARTLLQLSDRETMSRERKPISSPFIEPEEPQDRAKVSDAPVSFKPMQPSDVKALGSADMASQRPVDLQRPVSAKQIRDLIKARRLRDQYFEAELFADPAWDMLLDLMAAHLEGAKVSVSSLCIAASVPPTTALRWIKTMTEEGIFLRKADEKDGRRIFIELSDEATAGMIGYFSMVRRNRMMIV